MAGQIQRERHEIDAAEQAVGRVAARVAVFLRGKNKVDFAPHIDAGDFVTVVNASKVKFTGRKLVQRDYYHHTRYPGGLRRTPMKSLFVQNPVAVLRRAVYGMLPKNKHRNKMIERLTIKS